MSNYNTTLQSNNTDLQAILNTINELPSEIETCTIEINISSEGGSETFGDNSGTIVYSAFENGEIVVKVLRGTMNNLSINAVCGSSLIVNEPGDIVYDTFNGLEYVEWFFQNHIRCFHVTANANETATLTIYT